MNFGLCFNICTKNIVKYYFKLKYFLLLKYSKHKFICPKCCCTQPSLLRSTNTKKCTSCAHEVDWQLTEGQLPLIRSNRMVKRNEKN